MLCLFPLFQSQVVPPPPPPVIIADEPEYEVQEILKSQFRGHGRSRTLHFLVKWLNYGRDRNSWQPMINCVSARKRIEAYYDKFPRAAGHNSWQQLYEEARLQRDEEEDAST